LTVGWIATLTYLAAGFVGYTRGGSTGGDLHVLLALVAALLVLFSHSWIMFYLIGTGKAIKEAVTEHGLPEEWIERTRDFKNACYPAMMLAMALVMAAFILGGGVERRVLPGWVHHSLVYLALLAQLRALWSETRALRDNRNLIREADRMLRATGG
jgi:hypothetical protein